MGRQRKCDYKGTIEAGRCVKSSAGIPVLSAESETGKNTVLQVNKPHGRIIVLGFTLVLHLNKQLEITKDAFV